MREIASKFAADNISTKKRRGRSSHQTIARIEQTASEIRSGVDCSPSLSCGIGVTLGSAVHPKRGVP